MSDSMNVCMHACVCMCLGVYVCMCEVTIITQCTYIQSTLTICKGISKVSNAAWL